ncbi:nucleotidyltransferase domain-containing protein [Thermovibrio sp.]
MVRPLSDREILNAVVEVVKRYLPDCRIYLSRARGTAGQRSDFDFALECKSKIPFSLMAKITQEVEELPTLKSFDLLDLKITSPEFAKTVRKEGILLYDGLSEGEVREP